jgi:hypothetical protein
MSTFSIFRVGGRTRRAREVGIGVGKDGVREIEGMLFFYESGLYAPKEGDRTICPVVSFFLGFQSKTPHQLYNRVPTPFEL